MWGCLNFTKHAAYKCTGLVEISEEMVSFSKQVKNYTADNNIVKHPSGCTWIKNLSGRQTYFVKK